MKTKKMRVVMLLLVIAAAVIAQSIPTGSITGIVTDAVSHTVLKDVKVNLNRNGKLVSSTATNVSGRFDFKNCSAGVYSLEAIRRAYDTLRIAEVHVTDGKQSILNFQLTPSVPAVAMNDSTYRFKDKKTESMAFDLEELGNVNANSYTWSTSKNSGGGASINASGTYQVISGYANGCCMTRSSADWNTEAYDKIEDNEFKDALHNPLSTFSIDVDAASYSNMRRYITGGSLPPKDAVRIEEMVNYFTYDYPQPKGNDPFSISTEMSSCPWNEGHRLIHIGLQGKDIATENLPASNLVFLIDVSGSMDEPNKLPLLKKAFHLLVEQMRAKDRVAIVVYAGNAGLVLPSTAGNEKERILAAIDGLDAGGSTSGGAGIQLAYRIAKENYLSEGNNRVILATDGDFNVGVSSDGDLVRMIEEKREQGVFLSVLGFGGGNYKDSKMEKLADKGNGNYAYIDNIMEANKVFVKEMGATLNTIAKDVKLQIEFNPAKVKAYRLIGYENRVLANEDFNNDKKDAGELGAGHAVTAMYEIIPAGSSEKVNGIDPLKYQKTDEGKPFSNSNELMTVKFRYKAPKDTTSKLITHPLIDGNVALSATSDNFRFAASVAEFGMVLRDSKFKSNSSFKDALALARGAKGKDNEGYRAEFTRLIETAQLLSKGNGGVAEK